MAMVDSIVWSTDQNNWNWGNNTAVSYTITSPFNIITSTDEKQEKPIVFTKEKPYGVYHGHSGAVTGPFTQEEAEGKADDYAAMDKGTAFVLKVLGTVKPERKTVKTDW